MGFITMFHHHLGPNIFGPEFPSVELPARIQVQASELGPKMGIPSIQHPVYIWPKEKKVTRWAPSPVINGVITPTSRLFHPRETHLFLAIYKGYNSIYNCYGAYLVGMNHFGCTHVG